MSETPRAPPGRTSEVRFTYDWYREFLENLIAKGVNFRTYDRELAPGEALLRHDVDLSPERAVETARIEDDLDVHATYFFLVSSPLYTVHSHETRDAIREIAALGHDVGLHFSTHQHWDTDPGDDAIEAAVERERDALAAVVDPVETVSFHIPPEWVLSRRFDGFRSAYSPRFFERVEYCADSDQRWRDQPPLSNGVPDRFQLLTHPGLWGERDRSFDACVRRAANDQTNRVHEYVTTRYLRPEVSLAIEKGTEGEAPTG